MRWKVVGLVCLCAGCFPSASAPAPGEPTNVIGVRTVAQDREFERAATMASTWDGSGKTASGEIIGAQSTFEGQSRPAGVHRSPSAETSGLTQEVRVLAARVDRLERMASAGPPATAPQAKPAPATAAALKVYQVSPDGRTAWVSAGASRGLKEGQDLQIRRGEMIVGKAKIARVWVDVSELSVLWSNGSVQRDDVVEAREDASPAE